MFPSLDQIMGVIVPVAGFLNAGIILMGAWDLLNAKNSQGVSLKMFAFFILFQATFALNGYRLGDTWQTWGMVASMTATFVMIALTVHYRPLDGQVPQPRVADIGFRDGRWVLRYKVVDSTVPISPAEVWIALEASTAQEALDAGTNTYNQVLAGFRDRPDVRIEDPRIAYEIHLLPS